MSKEKASIGGIFTFQQVRDGEVIDKWNESNIVVDEGLRYILDMALNSPNSGIASISSFYIGVFKNNYTPLNTDTAIGTPNFIDATKAGEIVATTDVNTSSRPQWVLPATALTSNTLTNAASPVEYTFVNATPVTVYGAFLSSDSNIGVTGTYEKLISASRFAASRTMQQNDVLRITYEISASST